MVRPASSTIHQSWPTSCEESNVTCGRCPSRMVMLIDMRPLNIEIMLEFIPPKPRFSVCGSAASIFGSQ